MTADALLAHVDDAFVLDLASRLIATPGHEQLPQFESDAVRALHEALVALDVLCELVEAGPGRLTLIARVEGARPGRRLLLTGHLDTVPPAAMDQPFTPRVADGRLRGRGAVDMKGAVAAMTGALVALRRSGADFAGELVLAAVSGEEDGSSVGTRHLAVHGVGPGGQATGGDPRAVDEASGRDPVRADFAIVGEPTGLHVALAHKGAMWIEVAFEGVAAHGSAPELGVNAIEHAARFVTAVDQRLRPRLAARTHPQLGAATINVGTIDGGERPPTVAARCVVRLDRRWLPQEQHAEVLQELRALLDDLRAEEPALSATVREADGTAGFVHHPLDCPPDAPGVAELCAAVEQATGAAPHRFGAAYWTDAALLAREGGIPSVVCGPGDIAQAHADDEWIALDQLHAATRTYLLAAAAFLDAAPSAR